VKEEWKEAYKFNIEQSGDGLVSDADMAVSSRRQHEVGFIRVNLRS
jgi:hypothetical protein